ncbi:DUF6931 family protein [Enterobacter bugandensis]
MKEKLMSPEGIAGCRIADSGYENALNLMMTGLWEDALACLVLDAPAEKVLGWALQQVNMLPLNEAETQCASTIGQWLKTHDDALRHSLYPQAEALGFDTPLGALGLALFWMQGSMTPDKFDAVYPEPHLAPLMLQCALKQLVVQLAADNAPITGAKTLLAQWQRAQGGH